MRTTRLGSFALATVGALWALGSVALANTPVTGATDEPPQVLGLVATKIPVPLQCEGGECTGFFSAFCMQEKRPKPVAGQHYDQIGDGDITIQVSRADGSRTEFSATGLLEFVSDGNYTSIQVRVPADRVTALGATAIALKVPRGVSLLPRTSSPMDAQMAALDRETATGPKRLMAEGFFEGTTPRADAAALVTHMINLLPQGKPSPVSLRRGLWQRALSDGATEGMTSQGVDRAKGMLDRCQYYADQGYRMRMRGCLRKGHDSLLKSLNTEYWQSEAGY